MSLSTLRPTKRALAERQLAAGEKAQEVFERLLESKPVICPECEAVIPGVVPDELAFKAAKETMAAIGLGAMTRTRDETEDSPDGQIAELLHALSSLPPIERQAILSRAMRSLSPGERQAIMQLVIETTVPPVIEILALRE